MKRSRVFLIVSAFVLAITGVLATKADNKLVTTGYYNPTVGVCAEMPVLCNDVEPNICRVLVGTKFFTVYKEDMGGCIVPRKSTP